MEKNVVSSYREYINSLTHCVSCLRNLPSYPQIVEDIFTALILQASLEYNRLPSNLFKLNKNEKKEKKNAR